MNGGSHEGGRQRRFLSRGGTIVANRALRTGLKDMTGGFQCFRRSALEYVVAQGVKSRAHFFQTEIKYMLRQWKCLEVPITYRCPSASVGSPVIWDALKNVARLTISNSKAA
jgi:dolichol-phosphate mannosyltransferase